jgi:SAM-dependent methyltransferase
MTVQADDTVKGLVRDWWASNPMTYGSDHGNLAYVHEDGSKEFVRAGSRRFFDLADATLYRWNEPRHNETGRFGKIFDYARYVGQPVLEVGSGMGCMAMNWAMHGAQVTAVDLNPVAVEQTRRRFETFDLQGEIREADGEHLPFEDDTFAFAYSWGVLHHSPGTRKAIAEVLRVLRPGGRVGVMLYNRNSLLFRYLVQYLEGFIHMERRFLTPLGLASRYGDGYRDEGNPHTWPVTKREVRHDLFHGFVELRIEVLGTDVPWILDMWFPGFGSAVLPRRFVDALARRWGWSLWITAEKPTN